MQKRQRDAMRRELLEAVDLIDEAYAGWPVDDALEGVRPIIADAESSPAQFVRDVKRAIKDNDLDWLDELEGSLNRQISKANDQQLTEYYAHFAAEDD